MASVQVERRIVVKPMGSVHGGRGIVVKPMGSVHVGLQNWCKTNGYCTG